MKKLWKVAVYEYRHNVFKKSFFFTLLSVPLMIALALGSGFTIEALSNRIEPVGYVDQAGVITSAAQAPGTSQDKNVVEFVSFESETAARSALETRQIQAYYLLPENYLETRAVKLIYLQQPGENTTRQFYDFLQFNLTVSHSPEIAYRAAAGTQVINRSLDGRREVPDSGPTFGIMMPLIITGAFLALLFMTSSYLMSALVDEKENRTIEILATSTSPQQFIGGKVIGIIAIGFTLLSAWFVVILGSIFIANRFGVGWFQNLEMDWGIILASAVITIPAYVLASALMAAIGVMATNSHEAQSISAIFVILHLAPLYISWGFLSDPHSLLAVILSLLPFTSLMTVSMRNLFASVPSWQIIISVGVQTLCAFGAIWLASRAFRLGMLRYGQRLSWRSLFT